jgi:hypothetical protein
MVYSCICSFAKHINVSKPSQEDMIRVSNASSPGGSRRERSGGQRGSSAGHWEAEDHRFKGVSTNLSSAHYRLCDILASYTTMKLQFILETRIISPYLARLLSISSVGEVPQIQ